MTKILKVVTLLGLLAILAMPLAAFADGSVVISGGALSITSDSLVDFGPHTFSASPYVHAFMPMTPDMRASDLTFSGLGWNLTASATPFTSGANTFSTLELKALPAIMVPGSTNTMGPGILGTCAVACPINAVPYKWTNVGPAGAGLWAEWDLPTEFRLTIPGGQVPGTYASTWTFTIASGA